MKTLSVMLVDDEPLARDELSFLLGQCEGIHVVHEAQHAKEALECFKNHPVDLVFVDLRMPGPDGISLLESLKALCPSVKVVVVTAHSEGALQAFDVEASDYLLKPVRLDRLKKSLLRIRTLCPSESSLSRFAVKTDSGLSLLNLNDIILFETREDQVWAVTSEKRFALDRTLSELETLLPNHDFFRSHRTVLVRLDKVIAIENVSKGVYALRLMHPDHLVAPLARDRARELRNRIPTLG